MDIKDEYKEFVMNRISKLITDYHISEYKLSVELAANRAYINNITTGRSLPSFDKFFDICVYFDITPEEFFCEKIDNVPRLKKIAQLVDGMGKHELNGVINLLTAIRDRESMDE